MTSITYIGMDVHTTNYTLCAFTMEGKKAFGRTTINPDIRPCLKNDNMPKRRIFFRQRSGVRINRHRIDVILREALPMIRNTQPEDVGVIAPYRDQVEKIACQLGIDEIEIDTVHKFQGREKDTIVLTTVDDVITAFSDDPYLLNVAVSQAKKRLILVASGMEQPPNSNIGELIDFWTVMKHVRAFHQILILTPCYNMRLCEMLCRNMQLYWLCNKIAGSC